MPNNEFPVRPVVYPCLLYRDGHAAIAWLGRAFGFEPLLVVPAPPRELVHAELALDAGVVMLSTAKPERGWKSPLDLGGVNQTICVYVDDPDAHHARAVAAGAEIITALHDTDYGARGYDARDPEGHIWTFSTYRPGR